jgi:hypothetical protein
METAHVTDRRRFWTEYRPGFRFTDGPAGTPELFEEVERHRYELEPPHPRDRPVRPVAGARRSRVRSHRDRRQPLRSCRRALYRRGLQSGGTLARKPPRSIVRSGVLGRRHTSPARHSEGREGVSTGFCDAGGTALVMVYHRSSFNYRFTIMTLRRLLAATLKLPRAPRLVARMTHEPTKLPEGHRELLEEPGIRHVTDASSFCHTTPMDPANPLVEGLHPPGGDQAGLGVRCGRDHGAVPEHAVGSRRCPVHGHGARRATREAVGQAAVGARHQAIATFEMTRG